MIDPAELAAIRDRLDRATWAIGIHPTPLPDWINHYETDVTALLADRDVLEAVNLTLNAKIVVLLARTEELGNELSGADQRRQMEAELEEWRSQNP
jgi:hypothetical protein